MNITEIGVMTIENTGQYIPYCVEDVRCFFGLLPYRVWWIVELSVRSPHGYSLQQWSNGSPGKSFRYRSQAFRILKICIRQEIEWRIEMQRLRPKIRVIKIPYIDYIKKYE